MVQYCRVLIVFSAPPSSPPLLHMSCARSDTVTVTASSGLKIVVREELIVNTIFTSILFKPDSNQIQTKNVSCWCNAVIHRVDCPHFWIFDVGKDWRGHLWLNLVLILDLHYVCIPISCWQSRRLELILPSMRLVDSGVCANQTKNTFKCWLFMRSFSQIFS